MAEKKTAKETAPVETVKSEVDVMIDGLVARAQVALPKTVDRVARRQVLSSVGQAILIDTYRSLFAADGMDVGQILLTKSDFSTPEHAANIRQCILAFFAYGIVPVVNENDTVSVESLMFTDNDELAGLLAGLIGADLLIILSSIDGLYDGDPDSPEARLIREVQPGEDLSRFVSKTKTSQGRGGMETKLRVAMGTAAKGIAVMVASGFRHGVLAGLVDGADIPCTRFLPAPRG